MLGLGSEESITKFNKVNFLFNISMKLNKQLFDGYPGLQDMNKVYEFTIILHAGTIKLSDLV